ncbi:SpoIIE family protein phosphatase [Streptomyces sp. BE20]|uniref:SpoIIE family protein phosphatase n=1 Tax=Streptomyces sp. BE20 TaxID=3002525 RepID=UPI002E760943|nr:SpoIIE family protein phosphatase [Streptomyces sp. BE20]MEE1825173.1 SpoIIE family protein phosphatase [Streptomyces sp. BE20]
MFEPQLTPEVFDRAIVAIALTAGREHRLVYRNDAFRDLFGPRPLGVPVGELFTEPQEEGLVDTLDLVLADTTARQVTTPRTLEGSGDGEREHRHFVYSCSPVASRFGPGVLVAAIDTTGQVHSAQRAQRLSTERLHALQRYEALVSAVSQLVWTAQPDGAMTELVPGWERLTGHPWRDTMDEAWMSLVHPNDRAGLRERWMEAEAGEPAMFEHTYRLRFASGEYRHITARGVPIVREGELVEWVGATADVEDRWRTRLRERLLADTMAVTESVGPEDAFAAVAGLVVPELTDACTVFLLSERGHGATTGTRIASTSRAGLPPLPPLRGQTFRLGPVALRAVADRTPALLTFPPGEIPAGVVPEESARWLAAAGATSLTLLPLVIDGTPAALAAAATCQGSPPPGRGDIDLLQEVLQRAQGALGQTLELQRTRHAALILQRALLTEPPAVPGARLAARYQPGNRTAEVGGDWYDAFLLPDGSLTLTIGDVAGHDLTAATTMGQFRSMLRSVAYNATPGHTPADTLSALDRAAEGLGIGSFATAVHVQLTRSGRGWFAAWSNAGHPPPLLLPADGPARYLTSDLTDVPLCVAPAEERRTHRAGLAAGDTLILYTDGLVEVPGEHLTTGLDRLAHTAGRARDRPLDDLCDHLLAQVPDARDDIALLAFRPDVPPA